MKTDKMFNVRHSLSHLLAAAVLEKYPKTKLGIGPVIDNGFYYDFEFQEPISEADVKVLEKRVRELAREKLSFSKKIITPIQASNSFKKEPYKKELIAELKKKKASISIFETASGKGKAKKVVFFDLCSGPHVKNASEINPDGFKLTTLAGAYWRGSEKNKMLTRIYGLAFETKKELDDFVTMQEEAKKRDHKILGPQLDLFTFSDLVGSGLPLWTPRGTLVRMLLDDFVWELREKHGYERVEIPHITKKDLYIKSGHWDKYKDDLFHVRTREGHEFAMKPMNCPHHTQIYARKQWSYRELPQRYANTTMCYRDEQSGELSGLSRVRAFAQDDAHVFCRMDQVREEFLKIWDIIHEFYPKFGFNLNVRLSRHDPKHPEKYLGDSKRWKMAESMLKSIADEKKVNAIDGLGEAAFYGPKLDFLAKDSLGREWQVATIQLDMNMPERFDLSCVNEEGKKEGIVMIHAAVMGSIERFLSILIEHTAGLFPFWLAPVQVMIVPINDVHAEYAKALLSTLKEASIRAELSPANETLGKRVREAELRKIPLTIVIGDKEVSDRTVSIRKHGNKMSEVKSIDAFVEDIVIAVQEKAL
ncbi:MAG: threonine--tRNA ligase [bacterium]